MLGSLVHMINAGKQVLKAVMLEKVPGGKCVTLIKREEMAGPDDYPIDPDLQKWTRKACALSATRRSR
jgi:hypothetical protein